MENKEITLDKIELVKDRTGVSYREAKDALEAHEGNVVDAIISIEDSINAAESSDSRLDDLLEDIKAAIRKGNVSKLVIKRNDEVVLNLPVNVGLVGTVLFPWAMVAGALAAFGTKCTIELLKDNGDVVDLSEKASAAVETVVVKGGVVLDEVKDKGGDLFNTVVEKGGSFADAAKDKGETLMSMAKSAAADMKAKAPKAEPSAPADDLDLSDIELDKVDGEECCCEAEKECCCEAEKECCCEAEKECCCKETETCCCEEKPEE